MKTWTRNAGGVAWFLIIAGLARGEPGVTVAWTFATLNVDGQPETALAGARLYWGTATGEYTKTQDVPGGTPGAAATYRLTQREHGLEPGRAYHLSVTAYNTQGAESPFAPEIVRTFQIETMPSVTIAGPPVAGEVWRRVHVIEDGKYTARWELVAPKP